MCGILGCGMAGDKGRLAVLTYQGFLSCRVTPTADLDQGGTQALFQNIKQAWTGTNGNFFENKTIDWVHEQEGLTSSDQRQHTPRKRQGFKEWQNMR